MAIRVEKEEHEILGELRTFNKDGQKFYLATDVAKSIGHKNAATMVVQHCQWPHKESIWLEGKRSRSVDVYVLNEHDLMEVLLGVRIKSSAVARKWAVDYLLQNRF